MNEETFEIATSQRSLVPKNEADSFIEIKMHLNKEVQREEDEEKEEEEDEEDCTMHGED